MKPITIYDVLAVAILIGGILALTQNDKHYEQLQGSTIIKQARFESPPYRLYTVYRLKDDNCVIATGKIKAPKIHKIICPAIVDK